MNAWTVLGIAPTPDTAAIRRAYARCLKFTRPDEDADNFQRLLRARDAALGEAAAIAGLSGQPQPEEERDAPPAHVCAAGAAEVAPEGPGPDATASGDADGPPIVVRAICEPDAPPAPMPPVPRIVVTDGHDEEPSASSSAPHGADFSLEARERHWARGRRLAAQARALLSGGRAPDDEIARIIEASADLPRGPRREVEAALIEMTGRFLRLPDGKFDSVRVAQARALVTRAEPAFGWLRDDQLVHTLLGPRDAAAFCLIGQEEHDWTSGKRPRLSDGDARILFAGSPKYMRVYDRFRQRGRPAWRFDISAFLVPPLWAFHYRQTCLAFVTLGLLSAAGALMIAAESPGDPADLAGAGIFLMTSLGCALLADRFVLWGAAWNVRRARKKLLYDPEPRAGFLRRNAPPRESGQFLMFLIFSSVFLMLPYVAAYERLGQAAAALKAWLWW
jgi:hypothetical protein